MAKSVLAWHFAAEDRCLRYGDGRKIKVGVTHKYYGNPVPCRQGLHGSIKILDALQYAPGPIIYRVRLSGVIVHRDDKLVATERTYLAGVNAESILREFARKCAVKVIHLWNAPRVVRDYLETGDEKLRAAAWDAARAAYWDAAAAGSAARSAATAAAWDATRDASWDAAGAGAAAGSSARSAAWYAARAAARSAAWDAARAEQNKLFEKMVRAAMKKRARSRSPNMEDSKR